MENALLIGLSRQMTLKREMDVVANNIANVNTTGFKTDTALFEEYIMPGASAGQFARPDRRMSYVHDRSTFHDQSQGSLQHTGAPLDVAIEGEGYLVVQTPRGERYTRAGSMQINAQGQLVTSEGYAVQGEAGPIVFQPLDTGIMVSKEGSITVREGGDTRSDAIRGKLRIVRFERNQQLRKDGGATFMAPDDVAAQDVEKPNVIQGAIEKSNVNSVIEMTRMIEITRTYTQVAGILQNQHDLRRGAVEKLSEVPA
ncbi:MAG: flagellar basal-body rod protein FlgF [Pseudorhodoplanes sp.]